ncbi:hypothetical protein FDECE_16347 [Fusarium decemcellulare]|nr:hypothetical protein FDECE_16347 [Fusarium decemcellulare]
MANRDPEDPDCHSCVEKTATKLCDSRVVEATNWPNFGGHKHLRCQMTDLDILAKAIPETDCVLPAPSMLAASAMRELMGIGEHSRSDTIVLMGVAQSTMGQYNLFGYVGASIDKYTLKKNTDPFAVGMKPGGPLAGLTEEAIPERSDAAFILDNRREVTMDTHEEETYEIAQQITAEQFEEANQMWLNGVRLTQTAREADENFVLSAITKDTAQLVPMDMRQDAEDSVIITTRTTAPDTGDDPIRGIARRLEQLAIGLDLDGKKDIALKIKPRRSLTIRHIAIETTVLMSTNTENWAGLWTGGEIGRPV